MRNAMACWHRKTSQSRLRWSMMKNPKTKTATFLLASLLVLLSPAARAEKVGPWDLDALKTNVPAMSWVWQDKPVHALMYAGEAYKGQPTRVFAFYASPVTVGDVPAGAKKTFPGVVLV